MDKILSKKTGQNSCICIFLVILSPINKVKKMKTYFLLLFTIHCSLLTIHCPAQYAEQIYKKVNDAVVTVLNPVNSEQLTVNSCRTPLFTISCSLFTDLNVGQKIYAIGSPMGFENTIFSLY